MGMQIYHEINLNADTCQCAKLAVDNAFSLTQLPSKKKFRNYRGRTKTLGRHSIEITSNWSTKWAGGACFRTSVLAADTSSIAIFLVPRRAAMAARPGGCGRLRGNPRKETHDRLSSYRMAARCLRAGWRHSLLLDKGSRHRKKSDRCFFKS